MLNATNTNTIPTDTLATALASAAFVPMDASSKLPLPEGYRWCKLIKKGENSKLPESLAVTVPVTTSITDYVAVPAIADYMLDCLHKLQDAAIKAKAEAGAKVVEFSVITPAALAEYLASDASGIRMGQLSSERIVQWFNTSARDAVMVALANRLGLPDDASDADVKRLEQIANQMRDNLAKLASKKPVAFDDRVKSALNYGLDSIIAMNADDTMATRLHEKLNATVSNDDLLASLGL